MGANSYGEQTLSLKNRNTTILNSQSIRMLQTHVKNDIYNKYCLIHNKSTSVFVPHNDIVIFINHAPYRLYIHIGYILNKLICHMNGSVF